MELTAMAADVAALLKERNCRVSIVESSAGGLISASLLSIPGASSYFVGGGVIYTRDARRGLLGAPELVATMRGSCEEYALAAAKLIREKLGTEWALCETGASGPSNNSYGDEFQNENNIVVDTTNMNKILSWDSNKGIMIQFLEITYSPKGVTLILSP